MRRLLLPVILILMAGIALAADTPSVDVIRIDDKVINPIAVEYIATAIDRAERDGAECLIIELDTPGGMLSSTHTIVKEMMDSDVPLVVYVAPSGSRAGSAGTWITLAGHIAAMAPSTNIGAAHPVTMGGEGGGDFWKRTSKELQKYLERQREEEEKRRALEQGQEGEDEAATGEGEEVPKAAEEPEEQPIETEEQPDGNPMAHKVLNDAVASIRTVAETRGRNADWAADAVINSISATEDEALEQNVVDFVCEDLDDLLVKIDGMRVEIRGETRVLRTKGAEVRRISMTTRQRILNVIIDPNIAYILMMLGVYGLIFEITHPGIGVPGIAGVICLILAFYAFQTLPINYAGLALILLSFGLFVAEVKFTSYGLLTLGGLVSMILGSLMLVESSSPFMRIAPSIVFPIALATAAIVIFLLTLVVKSQARKSVTGRSGLVGQIGTVRTEISPSGKVFIHGEIWDAYSKEVIHEGEKIRVVDLDGLTLIAERAE